VIAMNKLRVLIVRNPAGSTTPVAEWLEANGHSARIIETQANDPYNMTGRSHTARITKTHRALYYALYEEIKNFKPTHIHVNASHHALAMSRLFAPLTPILFHYHGSELRNRCIFAGLPEYWEIPLAEKRIVSTPDLADYGECYDRIIPTMFTYRGGRKKGTALLMYAEFFPKDTRPYAKQVAKALGLELTIINRSSPDFIPIHYEEMPELYSKFEFYFDFKACHALSKSSLEAMNCGCRVLHDDFDYTDELTLDDLRGLSCVNTCEDYVDLYNSLPRPSILKAICRFPRLVGSTHKRIGLGVLIVLKTTIKKIRGYLR